MNTDTLKLQADADQLLAMCREAVDKLGPIGSSFVAASLADMARSKEPFAALCGKLGMLGLAHLTRSIAENIE